MPLRLQKGFIPVVILIVVVLVIGAGGAYYFKSRSIPTRAPSPEATTSASPSAMIVYKNPIHGFQFEYSPIFAFEKSDNAVNAYLVPSGAKNPSDENAIMITVRHKTGDAETSLTPLTEYAKVAATQEIMNYVSLASIETITTKNGDIGYKTTWNRSGPFADGIELSTKHEPSDPITYFALPNEPYYTVQFYLNNMDYLDEYNQIIKSYSTK